jgi:small subunit ribosomal protein S4
MGSIKKIRKKYSKPAHPWRIARIEEENALSKQYGIPRKTELWKASSKLESFKNQTKTLSTLTTNQAGIERDKLFEKLRNYDLIKAGETSDAILGVTLHNILNRRLQTIVHKKGFAKSMKQARQLIIHRHILVNNKILTSPGYMVRVAEESTVEISPKSSFYDTNHPERIKEATKRVPKIKTDKDNFRKRNKR